MQILEFEKENIGGAQVHDICDKLRRDEVKALTLRECVLTDKDYKRILKFVGASKNIRHLSLSIGIIPDTFRVHVLAQALQKNQSLTGLFIHGNQIGEAGVKILHPSLLKHPHIISLDVGDCGIGDDGLGLICQLLTKRHGHPGLEELVLSSNPAITAKGWATLGMALSVGCSLRRLYVDYNELGDSSASCILVAVAGSKTLETLDMECVGATETVGQVLLHLVQNYSIAVTNINLEENNISQATLEAIKMHMPSLMEDELSNGIHSDEEHSLATSEPPLDPDCDFGELVSPTNHISIIGATDSPLYTPDENTINATDRTTGTNEISAVVDEELRELEANNCVAEIQSDGRIERDVPDDNIIHKVVSVNEALTALDMEPGLTIDTEIEHIKDDKLSVRTVHGKDEPYKQPEPEESMNEDRADEKGYSEKQLETVDIPLGAKNATKMKPGKRQKDENKVSLADRIKSQRQNDEPTNIVTVIPTAETDDDMNSKVTEYISSPKEINEHVEEQTNRAEQVKEIPTFGSVEEVEDIEDLDDNAINKAHDSLSIPETPSRLSLCNSPGAKSSSSIYDDENLLKITPSNSVNRLRRYSHNIEIEDKDRHNLKDIAKHRGSEGNIAARFSNRRGSVPFNARLTVHGVGSSSNIDDLQSFDTKRRLSCASTLGDVA